MPEGYGTREGLDRPSRFEVLISAVPALRLFSPEGQAVSKGLINHLPHISLTLRTHSF